MVIKKLPATSIPEQVSGQKFSIYFYFLTTFGDVAILSVS